MIDTGNDMFCQSEESWFEVTIYFQLFSENAPPPHALP